MIGKLIAYYFFGPKTPKAKFSRNTITILLLFSFYYYMEYSMGYSFFNFSGKEVYITEPVALHKFRVGAALQVYGVALLLIIWQYYKWILKGSKNQEVDYFKEENTSIRANYRKNKVENINFVKTNDEKENKKKKDNKIDPTKAMF